MPISISAMLSQLACLASESAAAQKLAAAATRRRPSYNPPVNLLNADLHCHSIVSDGTLNPKPWRHAPRPTASSCGR